MTMSISIKLLKKCFSKEKLRHLPLFRVGLGFILNTVGFIVICVIYKDAFLSTATTKGLFGVIIIYIAVFYGVVITIIIGYYSNSNKKEKTAYFGFYKMFDTGFDLLCLFYSLVLSEWEMTDFSKATTILASFDMFIDICIIIKNVFDYRK